MIAELLCRCGCGLATAKVRFGPTDPLPEKLLGYVRGHDKGATPTLLGPDWMARQRRAKLVINTVIASLREDAEFRRIAARGNR